MNAIETPVALITGGTGGIGQAIAAQLLSEGIKVILAARDRKVTLPPSLDRCQILEMDVSDPDQVAQGFAALYAQHHRLDLLVNAAGSAEFRPIQRLRVEDWDRTLGVHARGCFLCSQQAIKLMKPKKAGLLIHIASLAAKQPKPGFAAYGAAKAAIANFSESLNAEVGRYGIRSIVIHPSYVDTPLLGEHDLSPQQLIPPSTLAHFIGTIWQLPSHVTLPELTLSTIAG